MWSRRYLKELMQRDIKPRDIMKRAAFENAMVMVMVPGGSTNAGGWHVVAGGWRWSGTGGDAAAEACLGEQGGGSWWSARVNQVQRSQVGGWPH